MSSSDRRLRAALAAATSLILAAATVAPASAGGLFLPSSGVRAGARGGAFVAGADDPAALWYNPAGLAALAGGKTRDSVLFDLSIVAHPVRYERVDSGGNPQPAVENETQTIPLPTLAAAFDLGKEWVLGVGISTPWASLDSYPETGPQRYSLISLHHTLLSFGQVGLAWRVNDKLSVGASLSNLFFVFNSRVVFSACPSEIACAPEDPDWDAVGEIKHSSFFNPSGALGLIYRPQRKLALGLSFQLPYLVSAGGKVRTRLPASGFYDGAHVEGEQAELEITFPSTLRLGVEAQLAANWRAELGFSWEMWSQQEEIVLTPKGIRIEDQAGVGLYELGPITIPRGLEDTYALRLGVEGMPVAKLGLTVRAGYVFETGAAPDAYLSVLTPDSSKHLFSLGAGMRFGRVRVDAVFAHAAVADREVSREETCASQLNPVRTGQGQDPTVCVHDGAPEHVYVGAGQYSSSWTSFGLGLAAEF